jgi:hypothetical protein
MAAQGWRCQSESFARSDPTGVLRLFYFSSGRKQGQLELAIQNHQPDSRKLPVPGPGPLKPRPQSPSPCLMSALHSCSGALLRVAPGTLAAAAYCARDRLCCAYWTKTHLSTISSNSFPNERAFVKSLTNPQIQTQQIRHRSK